MPLESRLKQSQELKNSHPSQTANLVEIFSAIQGEGLNIGTRQIFIRFARCDLRCHFCDSAHTWETSETCRVEKTPGKRDFETHPNPVTPSQLLAWVQQQNIPRLHDSISLTGGEPLLQTAFLSQFLPQLREATRIPIYLESGGHRPQQVSSLLPYLDQVGMDIKLPSVSGEERWQAHADFLQRCHDSSVNVFVKLIISNQTNPAELQYTAELVAQIHPDIPVILQPVTLLPEPLQAGAIYPPSPEQVLAWQTQMKQVLQEVRVIPQTHKMIDQL